MFKRSAFRYDFYMFLTLSVLGYLIGCTYRLYFQNNTCFNIRGENNVTENNETENKVIENNLLLVAVKSTTGYLIRYGDIIMKTWGNHIPGHVLFYLDDQPYSGDLPVINLPHLHNGSTSVHKTISILKSLSATYSQRYEWFLIIDDQTFLHSERLESFLRTVNSRGQKWYMGRLMKNESYCESETGIVLSQHAVNMIAPHLDQCEQQAESADADIVLGSCFKQYLDISCTGSVEIGQMFVNNHGGFFYPDKINDELAFLIHPVLRPPSMYLWARYFQIQNATQQRIKLVELQEEINSMNNNLAEKNYDRVANGDNDDDDPKPEPEPEVDEYRDKIEFDDENDQYDDSRGGLMEEGSSNVDSGVDVDVYPYSFWSLVRYNSLLHVQNTHNAAKRAVNALVPHTNWDFSPTRYIRFPGGKTIQNIIIAKNRGERIIASFHTYQNYTEPEVRFNDVDDTNTIWVILPLFKKVKAFRMFLNMFADAVAKFNGKVVLRVVSNVDVDGEWKKNRAYAGQMKDRINMELIMSTSEFNRGTAKAMGTQGLPKSSLLVFIDVDMYLDEDFFKRVRGNTIYKRQVYFPICFSQYDPKIICFRQETCQINVKNLENRFGFWRDFGYGMVSMFKNDYLRVGGFDLTIKGWGDEDVNLYNKCLAYGLTVFRAVDPSLVHIYHKKHCAKTLPSVRRYTCLMSDKKHAGDVAELSKIIENIANTETK